MSVSDSLFIGLDDLEGIALRGDDSELLVVQERSNSVVVVDLSSRSERSRRPLSAMTNSTRSRTTSKTLRTTTDWRASL